MLSKQKRLQVMTTILTEALQLKHELEILTERFKEHEYHLNCSEISCDVCKLKDKTICDKLGNLEQDMGI